MAKVWHTDQTPGCREEYTMVYDPNGEDLTFATAGETDGPWLTTTGKSNKLTIRKHFCPGAIRGGRFHFRIKCSSEM
jgi:hypothetical protein